jgi:hypothetical protein
MEALPSLACYRNHARPHKRSSVRNPILQVRQIELRAAIRVAHKSALLADLENRTTDLWVAQELVPWPLLLLSAALDAVHCFADAILRGAKISRVDI